MQTSFDYATIRVVPRVECEEFINAGIVVFCLERRFLDARIHVAPLRLQALWSGIDVDKIRRHLEAVPLLCAGDPSAGPIAQLSQRERFHWLVAPRSTIIQTSAVHTGLTEDPSATLESLMRRVRGEC
ncbi:DUF3037 domain-containing protein [Granulicella sibirica]|uniref:DUF3037 domain-containing protein n=1 Tax=Granulicella sibirica TaxID=2479048 RepID=A0A4Q0T5J7_9BACT|nr:DUF3037 domain-containing protein [Granulicella sibirica]RXH58677.1 hypothetical protein GRAN_1987 [Granulicella sibirica]